MLSVPGGAPGEGGAGAALGASEYGTAASSCTPLLAAPLVAMLVCSLASASAPCSCSSLAVALVVAESCSHLKSEPQQGNAAEHSAPAHNQLHHGIACTDDQPASGADLRPSRVHLNGHDDAVVCLIRRALIDLRLQEVSAPAASQQTAPCTHAAHDAAPGTSPWSADRQVSSCYNPRKQVSPGAS